MVVLTPRQPAAHREFCMARDMERRSTKRDPQSSDSQRPHPTEVRAMTPIKVHFGMNKTITLEGRGRDILKLYPFGPPPTVNPTLRSGTDIILPIVRTIIKNHNIQMTVNSGDN